MSLPAELLSFLADNEQRIVAVEGRFGGYLPVAFDRLHLQAWLAQYPSEHYDLALRVLESVQYYNARRLMALLREVHGAVKEHLSPIGFTRMNDIRLVQLGGPGDSSGEIARRYREANHLAPRRFLFLHDVPQALFEARKANKKLALVFLEDFSGSGTQIVDEAWGQMSQLIDVPYPPMVLALAVATHEGVEAIEAGTPLSVIAGNYLGANHRLGTAQQFTEQERRTIVSYCKAAGNFPLGYREGGLLLSFYFATPNNSISVLRGAKGQSPWRGVLPRSNDLY